jgi:hypothetical protein
VVVLAHALKARQSEGSMARFGGALAAVLLFASIAGAAEVKKKDGGVIEGEIVAEDETSVTIRQRLGEVKIPKAEVESIDRTAPPGVALELERLKTEAIERLETLATSAAARGTEDEARALHELARSVAGWSLADAEPKREAAKEGSGPKDPLPPKVQDFEKVRDKIAALRADPRATKAAVDKYLDDMNGQPGRATVKVSDVARGSGGVVIVSGTLGAHAVHVTFTDPDESTKALRAKKGSTIAVQGSIRTRGIPVAEVADLFACRFR